MCSSKGQHTQSREEQLREAGHGRRLRGRWWAGLAHEGAGYSPGFLGATQKFSRDRLTKGYSSTHPPIQLVFTDSSNLPPGHTPAIRKMGPVIFSEN